MKVRERWGRGRVGVTRHSKKIRYKLCSVSGSYMHLATTVISQNIFKLCIRYNKDKQISWCIHLTDPWFLHLV